MYFMLLKIDYDWVVDLMNEEWTPGSQNLMYESSLVIASYRWCPVRTHATMQIHALGSGAVKHFIETSS